MKTLISISAAIMLLLTNISVAQTRQNATDRKYDPQTVQHIEGTIEKVETVNYGKRASAGIHLVVRTSSGTIPVHLGPQWYMDEQTVTLEKGDDITVVGSKISIDDEPAIIAREVKKGKTVLELRQEDGTPLWSRQGRR